MLNLFPAVLISMAIYSYLLPFWSKFADLLH